LLQSKITADDPRNRMVDARIAQGTLLPQVEPARALPALMWLAAVSAQLTKAQHVLSVVSASLKWQF
jgi:hypothetical protein